MPMVRTLALHAFARGLNLAKLASRVKKIVGHS
jgi:hypothetical protein